MANVRTEIGTELAKEVGEQMDAKGHSGLLSDYLPVNSTEGSPKSLLEKKLASGLRIHQENAIKNPTCRVAGGPNISEGWKMGLRFISLDNFEGSELQDLILDLAPENGPIDIIPLPSVSPAAS